MKANKPQRARSGYRKSTILAVKLTVGVALVWWLFRSGRFDPRVYRALLDRRMACLLLGVLLGQWIMLLVPLVRWWLLVRAAGLPISLGEAVRIGLKGAFTNLFVPGGFGIDGFRLWHLRRFHRQQWIPGAASVVLDRALGVLALLMLGGTCALILLAQYRSQWVLRLLLINGLLLLGLLIGLGMACGFLRPGILDALRRVRLVDQMTRAMHAYRGHRRALVCGLLLSIVGHLGVCMAACFGLMSLGYLVSVSAVFTVTPIVTVSKAIPVAPLGLGVSDSVAALLYPVVGLQGGAEVQMLLRGTLVFVFLSCGFAYFGSREKTVPVEQEAVACVQQEDVDIAEEALVGGGV